MAKFGLKSTRRKRRRNLNMFEQYELVCHILNETKSMKELSFEYGIDRQTVYRIRERWLEKVYVWRPGVLTTFDKYKLRLLGAQERVSHLEVPTYRGRKITHR